MYVWVCVCVSNALHMSSATVIVRSGGLFWLKPVVVVLVTLLLLFSFRDLWKEWGDFNFQIFHRTASFTTGALNLWNM